MKTLEEKYKDYRDLYYKYFVWMGDATKPGTYIPLSRVDLVNGLGEIVDGTINFAELLTLEHLLNRKGTMYATAFTRLVYAAKNYFKGSFITNKTYDGFFVRDDINPLMAEKFNLEYIDSMAYNSLKLTSSEDPCYSPFVSQDQVWNLMLPMFFTDFGLQNRLKSILDYIIVNNHKVYNPYLSEILHYYTFLPSMNEKRVKPWDRIYNRMKHFKPNIRVKRGANNWYFSYGFRAVYNKLGGAQVKTFWHKLWYIPFIWLADRVYHPYICKWFNIRVKRTSYYSMGLFAWYNKGFEKRYIKQFNKALEKGEFFEPQILPYISKEHRKNINFEKFKEVMESYPELDTSKPIDSPVHFLILYNILKMDYCI